MFDETNPSNISQRLERIEMALAGLIQPWSAISQNLERIAKVVIQAPPEGVNDETAGRVPVADYYSIKQAVGSTGLSESHIRRAVRSGELPASNLGSSLRPLWRIARKDLDVWMEKKKGGHGIPPKPEMKRLVKRHLPGLF